MTTDYASFPLVVLAGRRRF